MPCFLHLFLKASLALLGSAALVMCQDSLDGYSFGCGGVVNFQAGGPIYAFEGADKIRCPNSLGTGTVECGSYRYDAGANTLTGSVSGIAFTTSDHFSKDGILVSFTPDNWSLPCNVLALDWRKYFTGNAGVFFKCPAQNPVPDDGSISYDDNYWAFYETGSVGLTSRLEQVRAQNTVRRDGFGVYVWDASTERMRIYFGPWQGRDEGFVDATFSASTGKFLVDGTTPVGASCYVDSGSVNAVQDTPTSVPPASASGGSGAGSSGGSAGTGVQLSDNLRQSGVSNASGGRRSHFPVVALSAVLALVAVLQSI